MIYAVLPIKLDSKELPNKNIMDFNGKPMFAWALESMLASGMIDKCVVSSSECDKIKDIIIELKIKSDKIIYLDRPEELNGDTELLDVIKHSSDKLFIDDNDLILQIQPNKPLINVCIVDRCIEHYLSYNLDTLFTVQEIKTAIDWEYKQSRRHGEKHFKSCSLVKIWNGKTIKKAKSGTWGFGSDHYNMVIPDWHIEIDSFDDYRMALAFKKAGF